MDVMGVVGVVRVVGVVGGGPRMERRVWFTEESGGCDVRLRTRR
ncbi:hypothetical protein N9M16_03360 [Candidatus Dependentiae bacterium]|nr:hypothetical protein [Candidatus Dependentiae bacterium]